jgi:class 3 adenylate cyclase/tetratricopeptide (TPR) repeat protein
MKCPACQADNRAGRRFCAACGGPLPIVCEACDFANESSARFCGGCGTPLDLAADRAATAPPVEGERRQVTILFSDLAGYSRLTRRLDAEETHGVLGHFFEAADNAVRRYGGTVDKHIGDSVMAVFGAPIAYGNDAERAVRAALDIHDAMPDLRATTGHSLEAHTGIASGQVVASATGSGVHREYTVTGESVNLASRLTDRARAGEILMSDAVQRSVSHLIDCQSVGDVAVDGFDRPVKVWRIAGRRPGAARPGRGPFVGRRAELRRFGAAVGACLEFGRGQAIKVRGEAGIGKTRLVEEFQAVAEREGLACHRGAVLDFGEGKGQDAVQSIVQSLLGLAPDSGSEDRAHAARRAVEDGLVRADRAGSLCDLLNLPPPLDMRAIYAAMDSAARNQAGRDTVAELVQRFAARRPIVIVVEDIHWAAPLTLAQLAALASAAATCPAILLMTTRIVGDPIDRAWRNALRSCPFITIDLEPLHREEAIEIARQHAALADPVAMRCIERAEGNPLFLEQLLRSAEEATPETLPGSVQSLVLARIDRLEARDKRAAQAASIIGQRFTLAALRHLIDDAAFSCEALVQAYLVRPDAGEYLFAHALIRDGIYESLLRNRRRELHGRAARWFADRDLALTAEHLDRAADPTAAAAYLAAATQQAAEFRFDRALQLADKGLKVARDRVDRYGLTCLRADLQRRLGEPKASMETFAKAAELADTDAERCQAYIGVGAGVRELGEYEPGIEALDKVERLARTRGLDRELAQILFYRGSLFFGAGNISGCLEQHEAALEHARRAADPEMEANALSGLGDAYYAWGRMRAAMDRYRRCLELSRRHGFASIEVANLFVSGGTRRYLNELKEGFDDVRAAADMAGKIGHRRAEMYARQMEGELLLELGEAARAEAPLATAFDIAQSMGNERFQAYVMNQQARRMLHDGRLAESRDVVEIALAISRRTGIAFVGPRILGTAALAARDPAARRMCLEEGEAVVRQGCNAHNMLWFYRDAIESCLDGGDWDQAERFAGLFEEYTRQEPLPWADLFIRRGRTLAAHGRGAGQESLIASLGRCYDEARRVGLAAALPRLERALTERQRSDQ